MQTFLRGPGYMSRTCCKQSTVLHDQQLLQYIVMTIYCYELAAQVCKIRILNKLAAESSVAWKLALQGIDGSCLKQLVLKKTCFFQHNKTSQGIESLLWVGGNPQFRRPVGCPMLIHNLERLSFLASWQSITKQDLKHLGLLSRLQFLEIEYDILGESYLLSVFTSLPWWALQTEV